MSYHIRIGNDTEFQITNNTSDVNLTLDGDMTISGDLDVNGSVTTIDTTNLSISDPIIVAGTGNVTDSTDLALVFNRDIGGNVALAWDESADEFVLGATDASEATPAGDITTLSGDGYLRAGFYIAPVLVDGSDKTKATAWDLTAITTATTRTITMPDANVDLGLVGTAMQDLVDDTTPQLGGNLDLNTYGILDLVIRDGADPSKEASWNLSAITTATVRTITMPDQDLDLTPGTGTYATAAEGDLAATAVQADGSVALTANWDAGSFRITAETLESDVTTGTAPLVVASTTLVSNLNADLLDGFEASGFPNRNATAADPVATDDLANYQVGSIWVNTSDDGIFVCVDNTDDAAIWTELETAAAGLNNIVEDTTPQLGGDLDLNAFGITFSEIFNITLDTDIATGNALVIQGGGAGELTGDGVAQTFLSIEPDINQLNAASYVALNVDVTETATGSGSKELLKLGVGGTPQFTVDNVGNLTLSGTVDGVDIAARDHDAVTFTGTGTYISLSGQEITVDPITESDISDLGTTVAMVADNLSVFAATTSTQLAGVISDETGSGSLVFGTGPTISDANLAGYAHNSVTSGITASATQTQGNGALTSQINQITTVSTDDDVVTLPSAAAGRMVTIINDGVNQLQIFPASGDDLSAGVDVSTKLESTHSFTFVAYDATNWVVHSSTQTYHAEMYDEGNVDAFVINDGGGDFHSYHTNGMAAQDLLGWTFDGGGAGTSHAINSIADSGGAPGSRIVVTTGTSHGLAVGDIVSQTNLADSAYVGVFEVQVVGTTTTYEVNAVFTATDTGTMDQAATLEVSPEATNHHMIQWYASITPASSNDTFDFKIYINGTAATGTACRNKLGSTGDYQAISGGAIISVGTGDKVSFALSNQTGSGNITLRNFNLVITGL
jgi:hypothetical protein